VEGWEEHWRRHRGCPEMGQGPRDHHSLL